MITRLTFGWVTPLLARGIKRPLQQDDLFLLQPSLMPSACSQRLWVRWFSARPAVLMVDAFWVCICAHGSVLQSQNFHLRTSCPTTGC